MLFVEKTKIRYQIEIAYQIINASDIRVSKTKVVCLTIVSIDAKEHSVYGNIEQYVLYSQVLNSNGYRSMKKNVETYKNQPPDVITPGPS